MSNKKTLWYISKYFAPEAPSTPGGRGWFLMKELAAKGYTPVVITSDSNNLFEVPDLPRRVTYVEQDGVTLVWLKTLKYGMAKSFLRIFSWFHFEWNLLLLNKKSLPKPDAIVVSSLSLLTVLNGVLLKRKYQCPLIFEVRDIWPLTITEEGGISKKSPFIIFLAWVERLGYNKADAVIGTMPNLVEHVRSVSKSNVPVSCVPMGIADEQVHNLQLLDPGYADRYLSGSAMKVVHAGTIGITNALEVFFAAAEQLQSSPDIQFILVGDGALKQHYMDKYAHLSNLIFAPKVNKYQVQSVLELCDVVYFSVFPSKVWDYGQSLNKVVDYMLSGKPVLASYSGYPSMINDAGCGTFVPAGDSVALAAELHKLAAMPVDERNVKGAKGRKWLLEHRSYSKLADDFAIIVFGEE